MTRRLGLALLLVALLAPAPLRAQLVALDTSDGAARFQRATGGPQALGLLANLETEVFLTFCGPASLATALNSLGIREPAPAAFFPYRRMTQDSLFTPANLAVKSYAAVQGGGLTLDQLAAFARNLGASAEALHADALDVTTLRARISAALADPSSRVIVNYSRIPLDQEGDGHISPVAAFDAASDTVLILDVARYKYPPVWVPVATLLPAMQRVDPDSGRARGVLVLSVRRPQ
ncbi:phytochelatin synthase family protein [Neoroseomonas oryzicola]|uniref:glutathione gamma-glutamylcysteinyltransferase n=1 Tax=Neoroseomonas oryzicola TaxID=535904 RepID=A0A9X9WLN8_9PROT|nr:phytochelatin synthase family protein [Neoroseomonas oryzicola]MBR0661248.1 glutathione gamma-glutamylcysteinyltransferase [Neoroseomonas oryzicola]NKE16555.1 glutathione gamma-glutamylcysteinyltransferase [Neoroseomonas oryzicola]